MILKQVIKIYEIDDLFLYEIIEDYKDAADKDEQNEIFQAFCQSLWQSPNKIRRYTKSITYHVQPNLLKTEIGQIFDTWSSVGYKTYRPTINQDDWIPLLRQKINNLYTVFFDKDVILDKEYLDLLKVPKDLYYRWIRGEQMTKEYVLTTIDDAIEESNLVKLKLQKCKMTMRWNDYKLLIEDFLQKCFDNSQLIGDYEDKDSVMRLDFISEDHFYVAYFSRSLQGYLQNYQKTYYGVRRNKKYKRCTICGALIENTGKNRKYCEDCKKTRRKERNRAYYIKTFLKSS